LQEITNSHMKRILFVDDDPLVVRIYKETLSRQGFHVEPAHDGASASKLLQGTRPDLLVVDLMMPGNQGVALLDSVRSEARLAGLPIITFSNSYIDALPQGNPALGPQKTLLKVRCTPSVLLGVVRELLNEHPVENSNLQLAETFNPRSEPGAHPVPKASNLSASPATPSSTGPSSNSDAQFRIKAREDFFQHAANTCTGLHESFQAFARAKTDTERESHLENLYRKVHFLAASAGFAECYPLARMASVFEAMLFEVTNKTALQTPSVRRTLAQAVDTFDALFKRARQMTAEVVTSAQVLAVDDDALSNRLVLSALAQAQLQATATQDPLKALEWLKAKKYDLVLLDIEMPGMDGFELCKRLRQLPGYRKTPVIYVTSHSDFESRAKGALSGGDDLIAKPVFPMELAVKSMAHLLSSQLSPP
jgi:CheY-like chemotaxis protein